MIARRGGGSLTLLGAMALTLVLGSVHAFSVLTGPFETVYGAGRAEVTLTYSLALVCLTLAVLLGHRVFDRVRPAHLVSLVGLAAAGGCLLAAWAPSLAIVWLGYGALFGGANGLGYGYALQISAQANPGREGFAMGLVTAVYGFGAAVFPFVLQAGLATAGPAGALLALAACLLLAGGVSALLLAASGARYLGERDAQGSGSEAASREERATLALYWIGYGTAVAAGLMAIGHATGIARAAGVAAERAVLGPSLIAVANMAGGLLAGWGLDRLGARKPLVLLPLVSAAALAALAFAEGESAALAALAAVGFGYGAIIALYPAAIARRFGPRASARVYGLVFTAWGLAGLAAPWLAGLLFDRMGVYRIALLLAAVLSLASAVAILLGGGLLARDPDPRAGEAVAVPTDPL